jgi:hypothetical protein
MWVSVSTDRITSERDTLHAAVTAERDEYKDKYLSLRNSMRSSEQVLNAYAQALARVTEENERLIRDIESQVKQNAELAMENARLFAEIPEGCTPTDAKVLREANHALAMEIHQAIPAMREYARKNPIHLASNGVNDPLGVHDWIKRNDK